MLKETNTFTIDKYNYRFLWFVLIAIMTTAFTIFWYTDIEDVLENSILLMKSIYHGKILSFYTFSYQHTQSEFMANYDLPMYLLYGIWNIPVLIANVFFGVDYLNNVWAMYWCKLLALIFIVLTAWLIAKIIRYLGGDRDKSVLGMLLYLTSMSLFGPAMILVQYDCISLFFMLAGLYFYLKEDEKRFLLFFAIAIPFKMFAIFILVPLVLLREKGLFQAFIKILLPCLPLAFFKFIYHFDVMYGIATAPQTRDGLAAIWGNAVSMGAYQVSLFLVTFAFICTWCHMKEMHEGWQKKKYPLYAAFIAMASFVAFSKINSYWSILMLPFCVILILSQGKNLRLNILLETVASSLSILILTIIGGAYNAQILTDKLALSYLPSYPTEETKLYGSMLRILQKYRIDDYYPLFVGLFTGAILCLAVINYPRKDNASLVNREPVALSQIWARLAIGACIMALICYANLVPANKIAFSTLEAEYECLNKDLYGEDKIIISQDMVFPDDRKLQELVLMFDNQEGSYRGNFASLVFILQDSFLHETIYQQQIGAAMVRNAEQMVIDLDHTPVKAGRKYTLIIKGLDGVDAVKNDFHTYIMRTKILEDAEYPMKINGKKTGYNLYYSIR